MTWKQLSVTTTSDFATELSDLFTQLGAVSVTYRDAADQPVYEPAPGETKIWRQTRVTGLFEQQADLSLIQSLLSVQFTEIRLENWVTETLDDQAWERTWLKYFQPMKFGTRLWICPSGQEHAEPDTVCMTLDPGLAFGTGTHATTRLCLEWLSNHDLKGKSVIDFGCGSGILAIAAILLGAKQAYAIDIDPQALTATVDNAKKNNVHDQISCYLPDHFDNRKADLVIANILAKPLIELSHHLIELIHSPGQLILSGILTEQAETIIQAYNRNIPIKPFIALDDWCLVEGYKT